MASRENTMDYELISIGEETVKLEIHDMVVDGQELPEHVKNDEGVYRVQTWVWWEGQWWFSIVNDVKKNRYYKLSDFKPAEPSEYKRIENY